MAKYDTDAHEFMGGETEQFAVMLQADENGEIWNRRYAKDAWHRPKTITDYSLFSGTWTFGVPNRLWVEESVVRSGGTVTVTEQPQTGVKTTSREGMLSVKSGTVANSGNALRSKYFPRYQPNRGHLFSTAITCPAPTANGYRQWGLATARDGVYFRAIGNGSSWSLNVGRRRSGVEIDLIDITSKLPASFDISKGHVYDIQYEWRGVGNFYFYVDLQLVYSMTILGTQDYLSVTDPALGVVFSCYSSEDGVELELLSGCVDVTSEGGTTPKTLFGSVNTGNTLLNLGNTALIDVAVLALKVPVMINYNGSSVYNSRGTIMDKLVSWTRDEAITKAFYFRGSSATNLDSITWSAIPDSDLLMATGGGTSALQTAFVADKAKGINLLAEWAELDTKNIIDNPAKNSDFFLTPGDILVVAINCIGSNKTSAATLYYSEQL